MTVYVDTSVLVSALTREVSTASSQLWLAAQPAGQLAVSDWTLTEFSAAISAKQRTGALDAAAAARVRAEFARLCASHLQVWEVSQTLFRRAAALCEAAGEGLRAGDALHLAAAEAHGAELATLDRRLSAAAAVAGVRTQVVA